MLKQDFHMHATFQHTHITGGDGLRLALYFMSKSMRNFFEGNDKNTARKLSISICQNK